MFSFDHAQLPKVLSRKAFIGIDFQNDFTSSTGALPVTEPEGYVERAIKLAETFRTCGNTVIWTKSSQPAQPVPVDDRILATDSVAALSSRGRRRAPELDAAKDEPPDEEAFLSHAEPSCLKPDTVGSQLSEEIAGASSKNDAIIANADYSAFKDTALLRFLRSKMIMELFICGSLVNVGVYATAIEAAGHGIAITIVEDCCGYRSDGRQAVTLSRLTHVTGCDIISAQEVSDILQPPTRKSAPSSAPAPTESKSSTSLKAAGNKNKPLAPSDQSPDLAESLSNLQLEPRTVEATTSKDVAGLRTRIAFASPMASSSNSPTPLSNGPKAPPMTVPAPPEIGDGAEAPQELAGDQLLDIAKLRTSPEVVEVDDDHNENEPDTIPEPQRRLCAGDTDVIENVLPQHLEKDVFEKLRTEVDWQRMSHQGGEVPRLVAVQGEVGEDGSIPVYRHPSDESPPLLPFTPTVQAIKAETEKHLGHPLNHVLIQFYRDGNDYISEHSDKTIDVVKDSYIANVSLGAQRTMVLRTKRKDKDPSGSEVSQEPAGTSNAEDADAKLPNAKEESSLTKGVNGGTFAAQHDVASNKRQVQRATLRHNSLCRMGLKTNMEWLHSIRQDKRADRDKSAAELAFGGGRISLTFRRIGTFLNREETLIWGQGATGKTKKEAHAVINGESPDMVEMLKAFGRENHSSSFDWEAHYGKGFDVLHMSNAPRLFACQDALINQRVALMLADYNINYAKGSVTASKASDLDGDQLEAASIKFVDGKAVVQGDLAIMLYLYERHGLGKSTDKVNLARSFTLFQRAMALLTRWRRVQSLTAKAGGDSKLDPKLLKEEFGFWNKTASPPSTQEQEGEGKQTNTSFFSGADETLELAEFALWPVVNDVVKICGKEILNEYKALSSWYEKFCERKSVKKAALG